MAQHTFIMGKHFMIVKLGHTLFVADITIHTMLE